MSEKHLSDCEINGMNGNCGEECSVYQESGCEHITGGEEMPKYVTVVYEVRDREDFKAFQEKVRVIAKEHVAENKEKYEAENKNKKYKMAWGIIGVARSNFIPEFFHEKYNCLVWKFKSHTSVFTLVP